MTEKKAASQKTKKQKATKVSSPLVIDENIAESQEIDEEFVETTSPISKKGSTSKSSKKRARTLSSKNDKEAINRMWRYQQAREKWLLNSTIEADSEEVLSEDVVNIDDYKFDPEYISVDEWINIQRQEGVRHIIGNDIYLIIEDLGESNSRIIAPFTAAVLPAKDYSMYNNTFDNLVGHEAAENALSAFDLYLNACGPVWAVALGKKPLRAEDHSSL
mmetsp:Transcript_21540/g.30856  ORF Transcript_21540/g.30856 Transcript_21540/m.30856 type:complete len:218 (+) Transcript_21540:3-656(+)